MKFSIVIPTYNYARFLNGCLESVLLQDFDDLEVIVVDDGSTDDTPSVMAQLLEETPEGKVRYLRRENAGPSAARNRGAAMAQGDFVWCLDADDVLVPGAVGFMAEAQRNHPEAEFLFSGYRSTNDQGRRVDHIPDPVGRDRTKAFRRYLLKKIAGLATGSAIVRREVFASIRFPEGVHNNEDMVFYAHLFARHRAVSVPGIVLETHRHKDSLRNNLKRIEETGLKAVDLLFDDTLLTVEQMRLRKAYLARRCMSFFRSYFREGDYAKARRYYGDAVRTSPLLLLKWSYLSKYLRCIGRASTGRPEKDRCL